MPPKSKPGEGIVIVLDVSPGVRASMETTFYSQSKICLINILQRKIFSDKCKDMVGIVLFGTDETENQLADENETQYQHITVLQNPKYVDWDLIRKAENLPRGNSQGDWLDAIVVAMDLLHDPEDIKYGTKKIVLLTDFNCEFSGDQTEKIIQGLKHMEIELSVIGPTLDEPVDVPDSSMSSTAKSQNGTSNNVPVNWNGKVKTSPQLAAEVLIRRIIKEVDGIICSFDEAIPQLIFFEKKSQGSSNWNAMLDIGPNFKIPVVGKIKIKRSTAPRWNKVFMENETEAIISEVSHHRKDENQTPVEYDDVIAGYKYGTTLVPFSEEDEELKYQCDAPGAVLSVLGFTKASNVPLNLRSGEQVLVITAKDVDEDGAIALSAIIQALKELDMVAVTRRVYRKNLNPVLGALYPDITSDYECLIWIGLPFQEEIRHFSFHSLSKWISKTTDEERKLMDEFIDSMDLDENDDEDEEFDPTVIVNPQLQHHFNCLTHRALNPDDPLPAPQQHVKDILSPPERQRRARDALAQGLKQAFPTTKIETYKKKKLDLFANADNGAAGPSTVAGDTTLTSSDLIRVTVHKISTATPMEDFRAMLQDDNPNYDEICRQMSDVLLQMTESLSGDQTADHILLTKLIDGVKAFREESVCIDASPFNAFAKQLKQLVTARKLNDLWLVVTQEKLGLITKTETLKSSFTAEDAEEFYAMKVEAVAAAPVAVNQEKDYDDILDDL